MRDFDYSITVTKLHPPIGGIYRYAAKLAYLYQMKEGQGTKISVEFGEFWGTTEAEAEAKVREKVEEWINSQQNQSQ